MNFYQYLYAAFALSIIMLGSCTKYEPVGEGAWNDGKIISSPTLPIVRQLAYADDHNNIWLTDYSGVHQRKIVSATAPIYNIAISPTWDKIAYRTANSSIHIVDSVGTELAIVPNSINVRYFEWYDSSLLYGVNVLSTAAMPIKLYGTSNLPTDLPHPVMQNSSSRLYACFITKEKDLLYIALNNSLSYKKIAYIRHGEVRDQSSYSFASEIYRLHQNNSLINFWAVDDTGQMYYMNTPGRSVSPFSNSDSNPIIVNISYLGYNKTGELLVKRAATGGELSTTIFNSNSVFASAFSYDLYSSRYPTPIFDTK